MGDLVDAVDFYRGKCLFVSGVTGLLGKQVLYKLFSLFDDPRELGTIYVMVRPRKEKRRRLRDGSVDPRPARLLSVEERLREDVLGSPHFDTLRERHGAEAFDAIFLEKVVPLESELCGNPSIYLHLLAQIDRIFAALPQSTSGPAAASGGVGAALRSQSAEPYADICLSLFSHHKDWKRARQEVQVVVHCAASVNFQEPLIDAVSKNVTGALQVYFFGQSCERLEAYCHVSTAYVNCDRFGVLAERLPPIPQCEGDPIGFFRRIVEYSPEEVLLRGKQVLGDYPNTYTFSKALAEQILARLQSAHVKDDGSEAVGGVGAQPVLVDRIRRVPMLILRPGIISGCAVEPCEGFATDANAIGLVLLLIGSGILRVLKCHPWLPADLPPLDMVTRAILGSVPVVASERQAVQVVHACNKMSMKWSAVHRLPMEMWRRVVPSNCVFKPGGCLTASAEQWAIKTFFQYKLAMYAMRAVNHVLPATRTRARMTAQLERIVHHLDTSNSLFSHFNHHTWTFLDDNLRRLQSRLTPDSVDKFRYMRFLDGEIPEQRWLLMFCYHLQKHCMKEPDLQPPLELIADSKFVDNNVHAAARNDVDEQRSLRSLQLVDTLLLFVPSVPLLLRALLLRWLVPHSGASVRKPLLWTLVGFVVWRYKCRRGEALRRDRARRNGQPELADLYDAAERPLCGVYMNPIFLLVVDAVLRWRTDDSASANAGLLSLAHAAIQGGPPLSAFSAYYVPPPAAVRARRAAWLRWPLILLGLGAEHSGPFTRRVQSTIAALVAHTTAVLLAWHLPRMRWGKDGDSALSLPSWRALPRYKKTILVALIMGFFRLGKLRDERAIGQWLKNWERGMSGSMRL